MKQNRNICGLTLVPIVGLFLALSLPAPALEVGWHDLIYLQLGDGVDLNQLQQPKQHGLVLLGPLATKNLNTGYQSEIITYAQHDYDMVKTLSVNSSVGLDSFIENGEIDVNIFGKQTFAANDLKFVFTKTRNFGTTVYSPLDFAQSNKDLFASYQKNWNGEGLHTKIAGAVGTHYVAGLEKAATVSVLYTFHYASASIKQQMSVSASGSAFDIASFSDFVSSYFGSTNTSTSLSYQFYSSDPYLSSTNFGFSANGTNQNFQQFTNFVSQLENYVNAMDPANAKVVGYVLNPIQTVPGYLSLLGGFVPPPAESADYNDFLQAYAALDVWKERLDNLGSMSWLNAEGQQVVSSNRMDVDAYFDSMTSIARNHFNTGAPLSVPDDVVAYLANLSELRLPEIYMMDSWEWFDGVATDYHTLIGRVDCGNSDLIAPIPFFKVWATNSTTLSDFQLYYVPSDFETNMLKTYATGSRNAHLKALFASEQWHCLTNSNPDTNGFFLITERVSGSGDWAVEIIDGTTTLDVMPFLATRAGGLPTPSRLSSSVNVSIASLSAPASGVVGVAQPITMQVTNQGPAQAYGTTVSLILSNGFDYRDASGSQGSASFEPSSRMVTYAVGPLPAGATADIQVNLIPLQPGVSVPASPTVLTVSSNLTNSAPSTASLPSLASAAPVIGSSRSQGGMQLDWWSDTDRLVVESSRVLGRGASWSPITNDLPNVVISATSHRFLGLSPVGLQGYFRLHGQ